MFSLPAIAQETNRLNNVEILLDSLAKEIPQLEETTSLALRDVSVAEYLRAVGIQHKINLYIAETPRKIITHNLTDEKVKSVFLFICKAFDLEIEVTGSILEFVPYKAPPTVEKGPKELKIVFKDDLLSVDLKNDSLYQVIRTISALTGRKIVAKPGIQGKITAFLPPTELDAALEALFLTNGFLLSPRKKGYYVLQETALPSDEPNRDRLSYEVQSYTDGKADYITTNAENADITTLIKAIFEQADADYLIYDELKGMISISAELAQLEDVLNYVLQGTEFTYKRDGEIYLIGGKDLNGLQTTKTVRMQYRPTYQSIELIPGATSSSSSSSSMQPNRQGMARNPELNSPRNQGNYNNGYNNGFNNNYNTNSPYSNNQNGGYSTGYGGGNGTNYGNNYPVLAASTPPEIRRSQAGGVEIIDYPELNRIILKGPTDRVAEIASFLAEIDRPVPMVKIEMVVVEVNRDRMLNAGISAGLRTPGDSVATSKSVLPGVNYTLSGREINAIAGAIPALSNLGVLSSNFYLQLQAQETRGNLKVKMQPVLSTLNGREASLQIGQSQYYLLETQTANTGAVNNFQTFTQRFERIDANISLTLKPYVSDDGMVTLDIMPDFTTPVGQFSSSLPPTIATRRFVSTIRVKNGETVILGGLSEESTSENSRGLPLLSRIPILKWFFGNTSKSKQKSSLVIYITPVVYYN